MGYSKSSKQHGVNRKPIWRGMLAEYWMEKQNEPLS